MIPSRDIQHNSGVLDLKDMFKKLKLEKTNEQKNKHWMVGDLTRVHCANELSAHVKHRANERMLDAFCQA